MVYFFLVVFYLKMRIYRREETNESIKTNVTYILEKL